LDCKSAILIAWRRDIHEHPELGEPETQCPAFISTWASCRAIRIWPRPPPTTPELLPRRARARRRRARARHGDGELSGGGEHRL